MDITEGCERLHQLLDGATKLQQWPTNGLYFFQEDGEVWGHDPNHSIRRLTRCGSHDKIGRLRSRATEHFTQNSNGSVVVKRFGSALVVRGGEAPHDHWGASGSPQCPQCEGPLLQARDYIVNQVREIIVDVPEGWDKAETIAIGILSHCTLCQRSDRWVGQHAVNNIIKAGKIWNDRKVDYLPSANDLDRFFSTIRVAGEYVRPQKVVR